MSGSSYLLERAWVDGAVRDEVLVEIVGGRFGRVDISPVNRGSRNLSGEVSADKFQDPRLTGEMSPTRLPGLTLPGLANCHSHAFHRGLRGRTQRGRGTFWTWREQMYDLAGRLDPDTYRDLATAVYREMAAAGITAVGEFHYLHHQPDGTPYDDPNAMGLALVEAAQAAGIRIALLDTAYLSSGFGAPTEGVQRRYDDGDIDAWADRASSIPPSEGMTVGAAFHSVRAVSPEQMRRYAGTVLHVHLSEQRAENERCVAAYGMTPTQVLAEAGHLGPRTSAVHATHLTDGDIGLLGRSGTTSCFCPTTERDLGDGIGPSRRLHEAGSPLSLGSDSHAVIDLFEEMRAVELDERLATEQRGHWSAAELVATATRHDSLGFDDAGSIAVGQRADLVTIATDSPATAGTGADEQTAVFAATAADVTHVVADGRVVFSAEKGDRAAVGRELAEAIGRLWS